MTTWLDKKALTPAVKRALEPADVVLDIGCGIRPQNYICPQVHICCEPYGEYVRFLQERVLFRKRPDRDYLVLKMGWRDVLAHLPERSVDTVFLVDVIEHLEKDEGLALLPATARLARRQVAIFTPLGFMPQHSEDGTDVWGLQGGDWQQHKSGWLPEDFQGDYWEFFAAKAFHFSDNDGKPYEVPYGAFWAIKTWPDSGGAWSPGLRKRLKSLTSTYLHRAFRNLRRGSSRPSSLFF